MSSTQSKNIFQADIRRRKRICAESLSYLLTVRNDNAVKISSLKFRDFLSMSSQKQKLSVSQQQRKQILQHCSWQNTRHIIHTVRLAYRVLADPEIQKIRYCCKTEKHGLGSKLLKQEIAIHCFSCRHVFCASIKGQQQSRTWFLKTANGRQSRLDIY